VSRNRGLVHPKALVAVVATVTVVVVVVATVVAPLLEQEVEADRSSSPTFVPRLVLVPGRCC